MSIPSFVATITLYHTNQGGRRSPILGQHFGCPCKFSENDVTAWDCRILTKGETFSPGETREFPMVFLMPEAAALFQVVDKFYLWEGKTIGEARANK